MITSMAGLGHHFAGVKTCLLSNNAHCLTTQFLIMRLALSFLPLACLISGIASLPLEQQIIQAPISELKYIDTDDLQLKITEKGLLKRAKDLYAIAETSEDERGHPTRVIGSIGHNNTLNYIESTLNDLSDYYTYYKQPFTAVQGSVEEFKLSIGSDAVKALPFSLTPPTKDREPETGKLVAVDGEGCLPSDYSNVKKGSIALIKRGTCPFSDKSELAGASGAIAAIIYNNEGTTDIISGTLGTPMEHHVATLGIGKSDGDAFIKRLEDGEEIESTIYVNSFVGEILTYNIIAETIFGDKENVVMLGAHSDSVDAGPGINDDGSGTISLLEVATALSEFNVTNAVRFAWWSAEEEGLLGSDFYVASLPSDENEKIRLFMDYDMMASPNYAYQVYDANNVDNPKGSEELKNLYIDYYTDKGVNYTLIPFDGRSDYDGFIKHGIPGGGIATGAEELKTEEEAAQFGGEAGIAFDPCYHQLCDDLTNVDYEAWVLNTQLIAHSVAVYADSFKGFPARESTLATASTANTKYHGPNLVI